LGLIILSCGQSSCAGKPCVHGLRFTNPNVGYAYGSTGLYLTTNGGDAYPAQVGADAIHAVRTNLVC
jgi:hypothetical protein